MIESLFGFAAAENKNNKKTESNSRDPPSQFIQLIDQKKAQNLSILLRALNVTTEEVRDALLEGDVLTLFFCIKKTLEQRGEGEREMFKESSLSLPCTVFLSITSLDRFREVFVLCYLQVS